MRNLSILILSLFAISCSNSSNNYQFSVEEQSAIIGGSPVVKTSPIASGTVGVGVVFYNKDQVVARTQCSGVLISSKAVLTAASCFFKQGVVTTSFKAFVFYGTIVNDPSTVTEWAGKVVVHPNYNPANPAMQYRDLAVVELAKPVNKLYQPVKILTDLSKIRVGSTLLFAGFGVDSLEPFRYSSVMRSALMSVQKVGISEFEIAPTKYSRVCVGDAGGPVFLNTTAGIELVGVNRSNFSGEGADQCQTAIGVARIDFNKGFLAPYLQDTRRKLYVLSAVTDRGYPVLQMGYGPNRESVVKQFEHGAAIRRYVKEVIECSEGWVATVNHTHNRVHGASCGASTKEQALGKALEKCRQASSQCGIAETNHNMSVSWGYFVPGDHPEVPDYFFFDGTNDRGGEHCTFGQNCTPAGVAMLSRLGFVDFTGRQKKY
ncbi:S1 family peptidase [Bdellovibrio bacteriovorus]|uniref:S1 family peptidase n=1 Tax=Bdellovibrio bacteriovorus TaxID=959 RepID=UPI003AA9DE46